MTAQVLSFFQRSPRYAPKPSDWSQQELAEFYRVESALIRAGIRVGTDRGLSDENEPWFCFYRSDDGEVVIHFARIDGEYVIAGPAYEEIARGFDFSALVRNMVARHPLIRRGESGGNLSIHPAALLVAVVGTAFFKTGEARAGETGASTAHSGHSRPVLLSSSSNAGLTSGVAPAAAPQGPAYDTVQLPANQAVLVLAAALLAADYKVDQTTVDPAAQAAIASAAAALDFGGLSPYRAPTGDSALALSHAGHAAAVETTPAQMVSTVLSLVAVLSTLPHMGETPAVAETVAGRMGGGQGGGGGASHDYVTGLSPLPTDTANWSLDVRLDLSSNGLPSVQAVQLVRAVVGDQGDHKITVIEVSKLPDVLADIVARGEHFTITPPAPTPAPTPDTGVAPPVITPVDPTTPVDPSHPSDSSGGTDAPSGGLGSPIVSAPPSQPEPPTAAPAKPAPLYATTDMVKAFIDYFIAHAPVVDIVVNGSEIIILDSRVLHNSNLISHLDSMTFDFADGSSISLVGDHSSFLHGGNLV